MKTTVTGYKKRSVWPRWATIYLCFLCAPVLTRTAVLFSYEDGWLRSDAAGFASDAAVALIAAFMYVLIAWKSRVAGSVVVAGWCVSHLANFEHVSANGGLVSLADIGHLFDPTFFLGSAVAVSNVPVTVLAVICSLAALFIRPARPSVGSLFFVATVLVALFLVRPLFSTFMDPRWRRCNVLHANAEDFFYATFRQTGQAKTAEPKVPFDSLWRKDLSGALFVPRGGKTDNILLVILEGCCGGMLPSLATSQGIRTDIVMRGLDSIAQRNLVYANFITHQRQTNRGEFAILSGTLPKLNSSTPKMTEYVAISRKGVPDKRKFLPAFLAAHGFKTIYLQAAPLTFMLKDAFMPRAGFQRTCGTEWFKQRYASGHWGIDDKAFFEQALAMVRSAQNGRKPWFITLLTVGTHHPITIPENYGDAARENARVRAFRYLDEAVCGFIAELSSSGILRNTLVIITCDESQGISTGQGCSTDEFLCQQWGLCVVLHPCYGGGMRVTERFSSSDIALSVLDYLSFPADSSSFGGRSMFRKYREGRDIYFANTYGNSAGRFTRDDYLDICASNLRYGERYEIDGDRIFSGNKKKVRALDAPLLDEISGFAEESNASVMDPSPASNTYDFYTGLTYLIEPGGQRDLLSGQYFSIPKDCFVKVRYRGRVLSGDSSTLFLKHDIASNNGKMRIVEYVHADACPGDTFSSAYEFYCGEGYFFTEFRATAEVTGGAPAHIALDEASLSFTSRPPTEAERKKYLRPFDKSGGRLLGASLAVRRGS